MENSNELKYRVLIIYDITEDKPRIKLSKLLSSYGVRVQKSAFEASLNKKQYEKLIFELDRYVGREDSIRMYKLYEDSEVITYGKADEAIFDDVIIV
ncbi:CRISPR-associated endoribonuclease Cas2 [Lachnoanaerobaculum saburreum F0468]|jgi:CRISPR-associated endoribonuclease cas2|uniref:CRISPR-associated endoribonuclease Cas2 n=1 Tax=Lachnoanaerobaculum saburreum F0468 TaxID=1095750 RepID=I0R609_9FIRM|nr:CRISPR-associated endonuclease Cas2 [Lachnoanaerobaculum saburreum]EIC95117.1 CRISPR-associated endoribonuclease Cas2 [Lachnoanaerobaculum saburreum F0468]